jgi:hypothetical protein
LTTLWHRSKNWNKKVVGREDKMVLIAYHLLESRTGAYLEWIANELMTTANKNKYKDAQVVMLPAMQ